MKRKALRAAFSYTIPIFAGFFLLATAKLTEGNHRLVAAGAIFR